MHKTKGVHTEELLESFELNRVYSPCNTMSRHFTDLVMKVIVKQRDYFIVV